MNVDVHEDAVESTHDLFYDTDVVLWERDVHGCGEDVLIVNLLFDPVHQEANVVSCWHWRGFAVLVVIAPVIFELLAACHARTSLLGTAITNGAVNEIDSIVKINN